MEKPLAERAGLGWIGKNACLISPELGSFVFLGVILLAVELPVDEPGVDRCGTCRACLDVCPTAAFPEPYVLDARRCISYLTIEHRGEIPAELEAGIGAHVFGCDLCQDVCPWNRRSPKSDDPHVMPRPGNEAPDYRDFAYLAFSIGMTYHEEAFAALFVGIPVKRTKLAGLRRNAAIARANAARGGDAGTPARQKLTDEPGPVS